MSGLLQVMGVPASAILQERESRDSHDNAVYTAAMLNRLGMKKILLVTSAFHMRRSEALFAGRGPGGHSRANRLPARGRTRRIESPGCPR